MKKKSVGINAVLNVIKQCCAILFPIITFPYISRVLQTENYGKVNFGNSIITYVTLFAALGLTNYQKQLFKTKLPIKSELPVKFKFKLISEKAIKAITININLASFLLIK